MTQAMRVLFVGTSLFAVPTLLALHESPLYHVTAVVTQPDRPHGRGGKGGQTAVKEAALALNLPVFQPEKVRAEAFFQEAQALAPEVLVVAAFGQIIPQRLLDLPRLGGINVHGSLLPRWRGAAPMQYALMAGDSETGVTTMQMDAGLDTGDILLQAALPLTVEDNLGTVEAKLSQMAAPLLLETLERLARGDCPRVSQGDYGVTLSPSLPPEIGAIDWARPDRDIQNLVRGVTPRPGAFAVWQGRRLKILAAVAVAAEQQGEPGVVQSISPRGIIVSTGEGALLLCAVQPESKGRMAADAWARGARVEAGDKFESPSALLGKASAG